MARKIALIGTSAARKITWKGNEIESCAPSELLLALKAQGYTVVVVTSRRKLSSDDLAWTHLADHIFFPIGEPTWQDARDQSMVRAYQNVFKEFGFVEPIVDPAYRGKVWTDYHQAAVRQGAVDSMHALNKSAEVSKPIEVEA